MAVKPPAQGLFWDRLERFRRGARKAGEDLSSLESGRIVEGMHTKMAYGLAVVPIPDEGSGKVARQEAGLGACVCISWSQRWSP